MHFNPTFVMLTALALTVCATALWKGETPERWAAALIIPSMSLAIIFGALLQIPDFPLVELVNDGLAALGFLVLLMVYARLWLGAAMLFQAAQFTLHSYYLVTERPHDIFHAVVNNVNFLGIMLSMAVGTALAVWRRWRARRAAASNSAA